MRISIAYELCGMDAVSFGKACEIASLDIEKMKEVLHEKGIVRKVHTTPVEIRDEWQEKLSNVPGDRMHVVCDTDFSFRNSSRICF